MSPPKKLYSHLNFVSKRLLYARDLFLVVRFKHNHAESPHLLLALACEPLPSMRPTARVERVRSLLTKLVQRFG